jgi:hypothetical protein
MALRLVVVSIFDDSIQTAFRHSFAVVMSTVNLVKGECVMRSRVVIGAAAAFLAAAASYAASGCDPALMQQYRDCARIVDTLRPEKSGQMRVFAIDGSEFTAGQALWMQGQLRKVERLCANGGPADQAEVARVLGAVQDLLKSHQRHRG